MQDSKIDMLDSAASVKQKLKKVYILLCLCRLIMLALNDRHFVSLGKWREMVSWLLLNTFSSLFSLGTVKDATLDQ